MKEANPRTPVFALPGRPRDATAAPRSRRIDTHAASVFLAGARAFKVKRAVRFPFLDYSTLEQAQGGLRGRARGQSRRSRRTSIAASWRSRASADGRLALDGAGRAGRMGGRNAPLRREARRSTTWREAGRHRRGARRGARPRGGGRACARAGGRGRALDRGARRLSSTRTTPPSPRCPSSVPAGREPTRSDAREPRRLAAHAPAPRRARAAGGLVRRGHGDLHLGNIVLIDGRPVLFDAIEFSPLIASGDVLYDLAFLLMDLIERGLDAAANLVLNRYLLETGRGGRPRRAGDAAVLPVDARGDPRQGDGGAAASQPATDDTRRDRAHRPQLFRPCAARDRARRRRC